MYERASDKLLSKSAFVTRLLKHLFWVLGLLTVSVLIGATGLFYFENMTLENAIVHSAFLLSGFGIVQMPDSLSGKLFIGIFGLYANLFFLASVSILCAPVVHRILHKFHLDGNEAEM